MYLRLSKALSSLLLLTVIFTSTAALAAIKDIRPGTPFTPLEPTREQAVTTQQILNNLLRGHYELQRLDDRLSSKIFDLYLDDLDSTRSYLLASDVQSFERYRKQFDDALMRGDLTIPFFIYNRLQQRVNERLTFMLAELEERAPDYTFDTDERLKIDRDNTPWATNNVELDNLWRKRLKNSILSLTMSGKDHQAAIELLHKRYQNQLNRIHQSKPEDAYQTVMNAVTRAFDPHTQYFSPRNSENFNINMSLSLQGIGAVLQGEDEYTKVVRLVPAGPADKAKNLHPADKIVGVGQDPKGAITDVIGWRLDEVVDLIRGPKGTTVRLEIIPSNSVGNETKIISIVRDEVKLEEQSAQKDLLTIKGDDNKEHRIGVIEIPTFYIDFQGRMEKRPDYKSTTRDVARLIKELRQEGIEGLIIDLRNNGGGSLEESISLTGLFIPQGPVVQVRSTRGNVEVLPDDDPTVLYDGPLVVLVNRLSASASEIFAGAIQDYGRGVVVGGQTFGKGTVQSLRPLRHGQLKITQAKFYRVSGQSTQHQGVIPDVLYPSLFDTDKIGESALDEALPWDEIRPAKYAADSQIHNSVALLRKKHQQRAKTDPDFIFLREQKQLIEEMRQQNDISLNEKIRTAERKANDQKRLDLENKRRKAKGMELLTQLEDEPEPEEIVTVESEEEAPSATHDQKEDDALLTESGHILLDLTQLQQQHAAR
ncbi:carboxy terminal-processing peptidase [Oceanobacter sp. 3_MG-2023]|uniref:carboxy terminal-processing peptidase n=2 Tax=Gammaproteobacteria TaxID=1236 RepID=UPI0027347A1D|nr:carboxy terminal-processing peptidase [Oceanobacter sp. 3_MG-2023]MDP2504868.1 carboxy terminal-processing peptidase [Oceanobacter sp. 3_MG-2023]